MQDFLRFLFEKTGHKVSADAIVSTSEGSADKITLSLSTADINKFAASEARLVRSFRALLSAAAAASNKTVVLEINEAA